MTRRSLPPIPSRVLVADIVVLVAFLLALMLACQPARGADRTISVSGIRTDDDSGRTIFSETGDFLTGISDDSLLLQGAPWDAPLPIGTTTANVGEFTNLTASELVILGLATFEGDVEIDGTLTVAELIALGAARFEGDVVILGNLDVDGDITAANLSGTNTGDQDVWHFIVPASGDTLSPPQTTSTLTLAAGGIVTVTGDDSTDTITIAAEEGQLVFSVVSSDDGVTTGTAAGKTLAVAGGSGIETSITGDTLTIDWTGGAVSDAYAAIGDGATTQTATGADTITFAATGIASVDVSAPSTVTVGAVEAQEVFSSVVADSGDVSGSAAGETLTVAGGRDVETSITGGTLTIDGTADYFTAVGDGTTTATATLADTLQFVGTGGIGVTVAAGDPSSVTIDGSGFVAEEVDPVFTAFRDAERTANTVYAGPVEAPDAAAAFRALVLADLPNIDLDDLFDVSVADAATSDVLTWTGALWESVAPFGPEDWLGSDPNVLWVTEGGNDDTGNGSIAAPFRSLTKCAAVINASAEATWLVRLGVGEFDLAWVYDDEAIGFAELFPSKNVYLAGAERSLTVLTVSITKDTELESIAPRVNVRGIFNMSLEVTYGSNVSVRVGAFSPVSVQILNSEVILPGASDRVDGAGKTRLINSTLPRVAVTGSEGVASNCVFSNLDIGSGSVFGSTVVNDIIAGLVVDCIARNMTVSGGRIVTSTTSGNMTADEIHSSTAGGNISSAEIISSTGGNFTNVERAINSVAKGTVRPSSSFTGAVVLRGVRFETAAGGINNGTLFIDNLSAASVLVEECSFIYTGPWAEFVDNGNVMHLYRRNYAGQVTVRDCVFDGSINSILNSHPINDPGRNTKDQPLRLERCLLRMIRNNEVGPADTNAPVLIYSRGDVEINDCIIETDTTAVAASTDGRSGCVYVSSSHTAGTSNVSIKGGRMSLLTAGAGVYAEGRAPVLNAGSGGTTNINIDDVRIERDGNSSGTIDNGATPTVTVGALSLDAALVTTNSVTRAGAVNVKDAAVTGTLNASAYEQASLNVIRGLTPAADRYVYYTGATTGTLGTITSFGRSLIDDANSTTARSTLGLGTIATQAANNVAITGGAINGTTIGGTTPGAGTFTTLVSNATKRISVPVSPSTSTNISGWTIAASSTNTNATTAGNNQVFVTDLPPLPAGTVLSDLEIKWNGFYDGGGEQLKVQLQRRDETGTTESFTSVGTEVTLNGNGKQSVQVAALGMTAHTILDGNVYRVRFTSVQSIDALWVYGVVMVTSERTQ